jgi:hypothetical protein
MRALAIVLVLAAASAAPSSAAPHCTTKGLVAEVGDVRVTGRSAIRACWRPTGRTRLLARTVVADAEQISASLEAVIGGHYVWTTEYFTYAESFDVVEHTLTDVRTGRSVQVPTGGDFGFVDVIAIPGSLISAGPKGLRVHRIGRAARTVDPSPQATTPAAGGDTLYWRAQDGTPRSAPVAVPEAVARSTKREVRLGRCRVPRGAAVLAHRFRVLVWRTAEATWSCRLTGGRAVRLGPVTAEPASVREVLAVGADGTDLVDLVTGGVTRSLTAADGSAAALGVDTRGERPTRHFFWTAADGTPRAATLD